MLTKLKITNLVLLMIFVSGISLFANGNENADARYLNITHEYTLNEDGTIVYNYQHSIKLFTSYAFTRRYGESFIVYNPKWQKLLINNSTTTMADGSKVESPFNAFNEVLPRFANHNGPFLNLREMVVTHIGLEKDCVIDFDYTLTTQSGMYPGMLGKHIIGDRCPIDKMSIVVNVPKGKSISYYLANGDSAPQESEEGKFDTYTWSFENLSLIEVEAMQPAMEEFSSVLCFSTATADDVTNHLLKTNSLYNLPDAAAALTAELTKENETNLEKAFSLQSYVQKYIGEMNGDMAYVGYTPRNAESVFTKNSGTQLDKAVLLSAMLQSIEIEAIPVLVTGSSSVKSDIALLGQYDNALVICKGLLPSGEDLFLDPVETQSTLIPNRIINRTYFEMENNSDAKVFTSELLDENDLSMKCDLVIKEIGEISGPVEFEMYGYFVKGYNSNVLNSGIEKNMKKDGITISVDSKESFDPANCSLVGKGNLKIAYEKNEITGYCEVALPYLPGGTKDIHFPINKSNRTTPFYLPVDFSEEYDFSITMPETHKLAVTPDPVILKNEVGELLSVITVDGNKINIKRQIKFNASNIEPAQYPDFFELVAGWQDKYHNKLYIQPK